MGAALPRIELVVFDMDGVLSRLDHARRLEILSSHTGRSAEHVHRAVWGSDFERRAEAGAHATGAEYLAEVARRIGAPLTRAQWIEARRGAMTPRPEILEIARGARITTLTNNGPLLLEAIAEIFPAAAELFGRDFHASCEFGARKPEPAVFAKLAASFGVANERVLVIDDTPEYLAGARAAGQHVIRFTAPARLARALAALGVGERR